MRIGMLMRQHPPVRKSPIMPVVVDFLRSWGATVDVIYPDEISIELTSLDVEHDLYVLRSSTELALSVAGALHALGAAVLNPYPVSEVIRNKIVATRVLRDAGVCVPDTHIASDAGQLAPLLDDGPLVVKPFRGSEGRGVRVIWDSEELEVASAGDGPVYAQHYYAPDGRDRKVYCIGGQLFGVKRSFPARPYEQKLGEPFTISPQIREIALLTGEAFGIDLFGLDIIYSDGVPWVVDVSSFPGFKGVPDAALRLADYIFAAAQRVLEGEPAVSANPMSAA